jgi:hypothetical protein
MTSCSLVRQIPYKKLNIKLPKINLRILWLVNITLIVLFIGLYIYQVNAEASERYSIEQYQERISELSRENKTLEINSAQIGSLDNITKLLKGLSFEKADKIHYIQILDTQVVAK